MATFRPTPSLLAIPLEIQLAILANLVELFPPPPPPPRHPLWGAPAEPSPAPTWTEDALDNFAALGSLARTCMTLERITAPILFQRVKVSVFRPVYFVQLIRHFSRFPHHAALVQHVTIGSATDTSALSVQQASFLLQVGRQLGLERLPDSFGSFSDQGRVESTSVLIDVLLCQVLDVHKLVFSISQRHQPYDANPLSYGAHLPDSLSLRSLRDIEAHSRNPYLSSHSFDRPSVTAILRHTPAVVRLQVGYCHGAASEGIVQSTLPKIRELHLFEGIDIDLASVAEFCPRLQRCRLGAGILESPSAGQFRRGQLADWQADHDPVLNELLPLRDTLQELSVDASGVSIITIRAVPDMAPFTALRSLRWIFPRWPDGDNAILLDKLPPAIEYLCLGGQHIPVYDLSVLLCDRVRSGQMPGLRRFEYLVMPYEELEEGVAESVVALFEGTGVECSPAWVRDDD